MEDNKKEKFDEYEEAAVMFHHWSKQFRKMGYDLANRKKRALVRILEKLLFEPLEDVQLEGQAEKDLFDICLKINYCKMKIAEYADKKRLEKEKDNE